MPSQTVPFDEDEDAMIRHFMVCRKITDKRIAVKHMVREGFKVVKNEISSNVERLSKKQIK